MAWEENSCICLHMQLIAILSRIGVYGCHPYHNYSFVATVGATRPKAVFYGNNRADFSAIPGNMAPGVLFRQPDHFENYDDWPFLWGQNEGTIAGNTSYVIFGHAFRDLVR